MNTTTRFFQTKEQYLAFRAAFAAGQKDPRAHKTFTEGTAQVYDSESNKYKTVPTKIKHDGWMCSTHYLLFNLVVGKYYYSGFTPKTKKVFVECGGEPDRGLNGAIQHLSSVICAADTLLRKNSIQVPSWRQKDKEKFIADAMQSSQNIVNAFLEPLGGVFTLRDLARVQLPSFPGLTNQQIDDFKGKPLTYRELFGEQITDQTPDEEDLIEEPVAPEPQKKGLLSRIFS